MFKRKLPSNRVLRKITKGIPNGVVFTVEKVGRKWVAKIKEKDEDQ